MTDIFLSRQPILHPDQSVVGYELLYPREEGDPVDDQAPTTARVALNALRQLIA